MERHHWHRTLTNTKISQHPPARWGHNCCVVGQQIVFFGGYAESNYMNDVWVFNTLTMEWNQIQTTGIVPSNRSNFTMNYDKVHNQIIIFGGGGPNRRRFNSINILNWTTKVWTEINPNQNEPAPWQRTYHSAQLLYPYLVIFGGEGVTDLEDLWYFNLQTLKWREIQITKSEIRPCARRFHSSVMINNQFFVIAGCHSKYRCLSDIYSMDFSTLISKGTIDQLKWEQKKMKCSTFLTRWGHTSTVYDGKIYIFGGRFSNDLNDLLVIDVEKNAMKTIKTGVELPKARRRHCSAFIGSCLIVFGGFNGEYFNDLYYINIFELPSKTYIPQSCKYINLSKFVNKDQFSDHYISTTDDNLIPVHKSLISKSFKSLQSLNRFLLEVDNIYSSQKIISILNSLYLGVGYLDHQFKHKYQIELFQSIKQRQIQIRSNLGEQDIPIESQALSCKKNTSNIAIPVISLKDNQFEIYLQQQRSKSTFTDSKILINQQYQLFLNYAQLSISSRYFMNLLTQNYTSNSLSLKFPTNNIVIIEIVLFYLINDYVVIPEQFHDHDWMVIAEMAHYFCLGRLMAICQYQLSHKINNQNVEEFMEFSIYFEMDVLSLYCADFKIKSILHQQCPNDCIIKSTNQMLAIRKQQLLNIVYHQLRFDIDQIRIQRQHIIEVSLAHKQIQMHENQKQNYQINYS